MLALETTSHWLDFLNSQSQTSSARFLELTIFLTCEDVCPKFWLKTVLETGGGSIVPFCSIFFFETHARKFLEGTGRNQWFIIKKSRSEKSSSDQAWFPAAPILTPDSLDDYGAPQAPVVGGGGGSVDDYGAPAAPVVGPQQPTYGSNDCQVTRSLVNTGNCEQGGQVRDPTWVFFTKRNLILLRAYLLAL